jgi:signal transduction histidine kinase
MTSSGKQTKGKAKGKGKPKGKAKAKGKASEKKQPLPVAMDAKAIARSAMPAYARADFWTDAITKKPALVVGGGLFLAGAVAVLQINRWHLTTPVLMLWIGWIGVLYTLRYLFGAAFSLASTEDKLEDYDLSVVRRKELVAEKKSLLRAIKEIEFDRDLGKMSAEDAKEIMRFYRARAIEVIKEIDGQQDTDLSVEERVERDLKARLEVESKTSAKKAKTKPKSEANSESQPDESSKSERVESEAEEDGVNDEKEVAQAGGESS